jgi:hypothetical protein
MEGENGDFDILASSFGGFKVVLRREKDLESSFCYTLAMPLLSIIHPPRHLLFIRKFSTQTNIQKPNISCPSLF